MNVSAIIAAGGTGSRLGVPGGKQLLELKNKPVLMYTLEKILPYVTEMIIVIAEQDIPRLKDLLKKYALDKKIKTIVAGGETRAISVYNAFKETSSSADLILIHDGVRPFVQSKDIEKVIEAAQTHGAAVLCTKVKDTIKQENSGFVVKTPSRTELWAAQTPQVIKRSILEEAYKTLSNWQQATDDVSLVEMLEKKVKIVEGHYDNIKITTKEDLAVAEMLLKK